MQMFFAMLYFRKTKILLSVKNVISKYFSKKIGKNLSISFFYTTFAPHLDLGKQVRFLHRPAAVIRNPMFTIS